MRLVKATLKARATADGLVEVQDDVPIGKEYTVDLDTIEEIEMFNLAHAKLHTRQWVWIAEEGRGALPVELLDWPKD